jgi:hypothetical protein
VLHVELAPSVVADDKHWVHEVFDIGRDLAKVWILFLFVDKEPLAV